MSKNKLYVLLIVSILITILIGCGQKSTYINDTYDGCGSSGNLLESFLKGKEKVYFEYYVPKEYFDDEFLFKSSDSMYLSDVINVYNRYYLVHAAVSDIEENIDICTWIGETKVSRSLLFDAISREADRPFSS